MLENIFMMACVYDIYTSQFYVYVHVYGLQYNTHLTK